MPRRVALLLPMVVGGWLAIEPVTAAWAAEPFLVNTTEKGNQWFTANARLTGGRFAVVWESDRLPGKGDIYAQMYTEAGDRFGVNFPIASGKANQTFPAVAGLADGSFVVVWVSDRPNPLGSIYGQRVGPNGLADGAPFIVSGIVGANATPAIAGLSDGGFVVVWSNSPDGSSDDTYDIVGQRFSADGQQAGGRFRVNRPAAGAQLRSSVVGNPAGGFTVVWDSANDVGGGVTIYRISGQHFAADGGRVGAAFTVDRRRHDSRRPRIAMFEDGSFVVVWEARKSTPAFNVYAQLYSSDGAKSGEAIRVAPSGKLEINPAVGALAGGGFLVAWAHDSFADIRAQRFDATGAPLGPSFRVNENTDGIRDWPAIAPASGGGFAITWDGQDRSGLGIFGRAFNQ